MVLVNDILSYTVKGDREPIICGASFVTSTTNEYVALAFLSSLANILIVAFLQFKLKFVGTMVNTSLLNSTQLLLLVSEVRVKDSFSWSENKSDTLYV